MSTELVSVIVPIYNSDVYLNRCIDSILNQTYRDIEVILVDDGSTDNSAKICDDYQKNYSRVRAFHKSNGGAASARNYGVERSRGGGSRLWTAMIGLHQKCMRSLLTELNSTMCQ